MGVSTEYGAMSAPGALDIAQARQELPQCIELLELGVETAKGLDQDALAWVKSGSPTTYHFLDINLDDPVDFDQDWIDQLRELIEVAQPHWLCGDAGMWHHGPRHEGHMLLLPPILTRDSAYALADGIIKLREETGLEVFPENPPGQIFVGPLHILDFFALVIERADTGMLLDAAHLAIYQTAQGLPMTSGLDHFPLDRVIELHMAGGAWRSYQGLDYIEDDHNPYILPETWEIFRASVDRLTELRAVIFECERNSLDQCRTEMRELRSTLDKTLPTDSIWRSRLNNPE
jgi:uncharacterized protein (UPF0276 family)